MIYIDFKIIETEVGDAIVQYSKWAQHKKLL